MNSNALEIVIALGWIIIWGYKSTKRVYLVSLRTLVYDRALKRVEYSKFLHNVIQIHNVKQSKQNTHIHHQLRNKLCLSDVTIGVPIDRTLLGYVLSVYGTEYGHVELLRLAAFVFYFNLGMSLIVYLDMFTSSLMGV